MACTCARIMVRADARSGKGYLFYPLPPTRAQSLGAKRSRNLFAHARAHARVCVCVVRASNDRGRNSATARSVNEYRRDVGKSLGNTVIGEWGGGRKHKTEDCAYPGNLTVHKNLSYYSMLLSRPTIAGNAYKYVCNIFNFFLGEGFSMLSSYSIVAIKTVIFSFFFFTILRRILN